MGLPIVRTDYLNISTLIRVYSQNSDDSFLQSRSDEHEINHCQPIDVIKMLLNLCRCYLALCLCFSLPLIVPDPPSQRSSTLQCCNGQRNWTHTTVYLTVCQIANTHLNLPAPHPARCPGLLPSYLFSNFSILYNNSFIF